jgi:glycosyltransferase involved in cell wall biosynthesis
VDIFMSVPQLTVLLPCRNGELTLAFALRSVLNQTFRDFELLLINDGSTDDSIAIAQSFQDERIRILGGVEKHGLSVRLNEGVVAARGRYIARMDADDVCFPERFARQLAFLDEHPEVDLVGCRAVAFRNSDDILGLLPFAPTHAALCAKAWSNIPLPHPSWMGKRQWFISNPYKTPEVRRAEDQELLLRSYPDSCFASLDEVLLGYRQGPFQLHRTLIARRALLLAQLVAFKNRNEWRNAALALSISIVKVVVDCCAALPGGQALFFWRMGETASDLIKEKLRNILENVKLKNET